jgi:hypothetical protein
MFSQASGLAQTICYRHRNEPLQNQDTSGFREKTSASIHVRLGVKNGSDCALGSSLLCPNERTSSGLTVGILFAYRVGGVVARDLDGPYADSPLHDWFNHLASGRGLCCCMVWSSKPLLIRIGTFVLIAWNLPSFCDFVYERTQIPRRLILTQSVSARLT